MSKAVTKGVHWLPRVSQYSLHGQRNGRVDVLPPSAKMPTFEQLGLRYETAKEMYRAALDAYNAKKAAVQADAEFQRKKPSLHCQKNRHRADLSSRLLRDLAELEDLRIAVSSGGAKIADFRSIFLEEKNARYERAWIETARAILPFDVVDRIESIVGENMRRAADKSTVPTLEQEQ